MTTLFNFSVKKYIYKQDKFFLYYQILPKNKNKKYVITKIVNINGIEKVKRVLKHMKNNKNIVFHKEHLATWLDCIK